ncbi:hypothetical protein OH77DRAFT_1429575 [Trametes cingulata]|nr:hypothetical protein OH77DRAFT_1429575 [Trametes cingulata]
MAGGAVYYSLLTVRSRGRRASRFRLERWQSFCFFGVIPPARHAQVPCCQPALRPHVRLTEAKRLTSLGRLWRTLPELRGNERDIRYSRTTAGLEYARHRARI